MTTEKVAWHKSAWFGFILIIPVAIVIVLGMGYVKHQLKVNQTQEIPFEYDNTIRPN